MNYDDSTELIRKLNIKPDAQVITLHAPDNYLNEMPLLTDYDDIEKILADNIWIQAFYISSTRFEDEISKLKGSLNKTGQLWISWPKKSSRVTSDLNDSKVRQIGLSSGLVDVKVVSIDETWSGLKFVFRLSDR